MSIYVTEMIRGLYIEERNNAAIHAAITAAICG